MAHGHASGRLVSDARAMARVAAALWVGCGSLVLFGGSFLPVADDVERSVVLAIGLLAVAVGAVVWHLPWHRWDERWTLVLVPVALGVIAAFNRAVDDPWLHALFFLVAFMWIGLVHRPGTSTASAPLLVVAYLVPLIGRADDPRAIAALAYVLPTCVILGESAAWVATGLRRAELDRAASEARYAALVRHAGEVVFVLGDDGEITYASPAIERVLDLLQDDVVGRLGAELVHPDDLAVAERWFVEARDDAVLDRPLLYRVHRGDGTWRWIEGTVSDLRHESSVRGIVVNGRDVTERVEAEAQLAHVAGHDSLTGLPNRPAFFEELHRALERGTRRGTGVGLLFCDLDGFKVVNDSLGHAVGDEVLVAVANRLRAQVRGGEHLARLGGDEFTIVVEDLTDAASLLLLAERIETALRQPLDVAGRRHVVGVSVGIAVAEPGGGDGAELLRQADLAMYRAKELGKGRCEIFDEALAHRAKRRLDVEAELRLALERAEIELHYQPEIDVDTDRILAMEALVRWRHPSRGLLLPGEFIDVAEDSDLIVSLGALVLAGACTTGAAWAEEAAAAGRRAPQISVNVSPRQLADPHFIEEVVAQLARSGMDPGLLRLEITESLFVDPVAPAVLARLQILGVALAIDDFGTGYSSLSYLDRLPVDVVKIDRSFLSAVTHPLENPPVVEATIAVARSLGLDVVAEGVETRAQLEMLRRLGCRRIQGFYASRPVPAPEAGRLVRRGGGLLEGARRAAVTDTAVTDTAVTDTAVTDTAVTGTAVT
jgi:diguanylate cyclase (GGDEF)-like protein/PAS domain S-box-containing protein